MTYAEDIRTIREAVTGLDGFVFNVGLTTSLSKDGSTYFTVTPGEDGALIHSVNGSTYTSTDIDWSTVTYNSGAVSVVGGDDIIDFFPKRGTPTVTRDGSVRVETVSEYNRTVGASDYRIVEGPDFHIREGVGVSTHNFLRTNARGQQVIDLHDTIDFLRGSRIMVHDEELYLWNPETAVYEPYSDGAFYADIDTIFRTIDYPASNAQVKDIRDAYKSNGSHFKDRMFATLFSDRKLTEDDVIPFRNGLLVRSTGEFVTDTDERERFFFTSTLNADYDPYATSDDLDRIIETMFPDADQRCLLWEFLGYTFYHPDNSAKSFLVMEGVGNGGKSWVCNLVRRVLGDVFCTDLEPSDLGQRFGLDVLRFAKANICEETVSDNDAKIINKLKNLTGGGEITADRKGLTAVSFRNKAKFIFASNDPIYFGSDKAAYMRYRYLKFKRPFSQEEGAKMYALLDDERFITCVAMRAWDGYRSLVGHGMVFTEPADEKIAKEALITSSSTFLTYWHEKWESGDLGDWEDKKDGVTAWCWDRTTVEIYDAYRGYVKNLDSRSEPIGKHKFGRLMRDEFGLDKVQTHVNGVKGYYFHSEGDCPVPRGRLCL